MKAFYAKLSVLALALSLMTGAAVAQSKWQGGFKGGLTVSAYNVQDPDVRRHGEMSTRHSWIAGTFLRRSIAAGLSAQLEVNYHVQKWRQDKVFGYNYSSEYMGYLGVGLLADYQLPLHKNIHFQLGFSYNRVVDYYLEMQTGIRESGGYPPRKYYDIEFDGRNNENVYAEIGVNYEFNWGLLAGARFSRSFSNFIDEKSGLNNTMEAKERLHYFSLVLGYRFGKQ